MLVKPYIAVPGPLYVIAMACIIKLKADKYVFIWLSEKFGKLYSCQDYAVHACRCDGICTLYLIGRWCGSADDIHHFYFQDCWCMPVSTRYRALYKVAYFLCDSLSSKSNSSGSYRFDIAVTGPALRKDHDVDVGACNIDHRFA